MDNLPPGRTGPPGPHHPRRGKSLADGGTLSVLPPELLFNVLLNLDLVSLMDFRLVNRHAADLVHSHPQYGVITTHGRGAPHAIHLIGSGRFITLEDMYGALTAKKCARCDSFGGYIYLLTSVRLCCACFTTKDRCVAKRRIQLVKGYDLYKDAIERLPRMPVLLGRYGAFRRPAEGEVAPPDPLRHGARPLRRPPGVQVHGGLGRSRHHGRE